MIKLRTVKQQRRALITLKVLIGLLFGLILILSSCSIIKTVAKIGHDHDEQSFEEFATALQKIVADQAELDTPQLTIGEHAAIIGLNPVGQEDPYDVLGLQRGTTLNDTEVKQAYEKKKKSVPKEQQQQLEQAYATIAQEERRKQESIDYLWGLTGYHNGRFNDGNLHVILNKKATSSQANAPTTTYHFIRPTSCPPDQSCVCLCEKPSSGDLSTKEYNKLPFDATKPTPYDRPSLRQFKNSFLYDLKRSFSKQVTCKQTICEPVQGMLFSSPLSSQYIDAQAVVATAIEPSYMVENGFVIDRMGVLAPQQILTPTVPLTFARLDNGYYLPLTAVNLLDTATHAVEQDTPPALEKITSDGMKLINDYLQNNNRQPFDNTKVVTNPRLQKKI